MPAELSGLSTFAGGPNITVSNALPNTPFNAGSAAAGVGTGSLGEFGGYIPTPLPQFNNYTDYLSVMPGAQLMDKYAQQPLAPGIYAYDLGGYGGFMQDILGRGGGSGDTVSGTYQAGTDPAAGQTNMYAGGMDMIQAAINYSNRMDALNSSAFQPQGQADMTDAQKIRDQAFDPQNALYARTQQQIQDQTRAGLEARGLGMDPYAAGVEGSTMSNFNIDWQNAQLQRESQGGAAAAALGAEGANLQQQGLQDVQQAHELPYQAWQEVLDKQQQAVRDYAQYGQQAGQAYQSVFQNEQDIQNQFLTAQQQSYNQNQTSGFEDPFAMVQLQAQIEMQREQMNMQEKMMQEQMKQQQQQQEMQMGMQGLGMLGGMGGKGCWIAEAVYGVNDLRTHIVRAYLNGPFLQTWKGRAVMAIYLAIGRQVAAIVRRSPALRLAFQPLFDRALYAALRS